MTTIRTNTQLKMQQIKAVSQFAIFLLTLLSALSSGCSKDKDEDVNPQERLPFIGKYEVVDRNNNNGHGAFLLNLEVNPSSQGADKVDLEGFRYVNHGVYAKIKGNKMYISQVIEDSNERVEISGEGILEGNTLTYDYILKYKQKGKQEKVYENSATATKLE